MTTATRSFALVEDAFVRGLAKQRVGGAAFAATVDGRQVVSLWGGEVRPGLPWQETTPATVMSVSKGFAALCVQVLVDRGLLDVDAPVTDYWPEYGVNGKEHTTVRHVLTHRAGVVGLPDSASLLGWNGRGWQDADAIADRLATAVPAWEPGTAHGYHAVTYGWLVGELVRRVSGRTLGQFFRDEIAEPLGLGTAIGVTADRMADVAVVHTGELFRAPLLLRPLMRKVGATMRDPGTLLGQAFLGDGTRSIMDAVDELLARPEFFRAEIPSSNGISSAADLARLFSLLACDGELDGHRLLSPEGVKAFAQHELTADDEVFSRSVTFFGSRLLTKQLRAARTLGYSLNQPAKGKPRFGPDPRAYGCEGAGGQLAFCDPGRRISVGFVRSALSPSPEFALELVDALYRSLDVPA
jgi:CubicO group peptidase (beta-lactamase class C family)